MDIATNKTLDQTDLNIQGLVSAWPHCFLRVARGLKLASLAMLLSLPITAK